MPSGEVLQQLAEDRAARIPASAPVTFFQLDGEPTELGPRGYITIVIADGGSELSEQVEDALRAADNEALNTAIRGARDAATPESSGTMLSEQDAAEVAFAAPAYVDVRFLGRTLLSNAFVTQDVPFTRYFLPYAGGRFEASEFQVTQFLREPDSERLNVLVVAHEAPRDEPHDLVVRNLPKESHEMMIDSADVALGTPAALFATVTAGIVGAGVGYAIGHALQHANAELFAEMEKAELPAVIPDVSPALAVRDIIAAKRNAFGVIER